MRSVLLASAVLLAATTAQAETIRATSGFGPSHVLATKVYPAIAQKLEEYTGGKWTLQDTPGGLVAPNEMNTGLRDGVTELGALLMPYFAADYPESGLTAELLIAGSNNLAISSAVTEYIVTCAECQAEFAEFRQVYLGSDTTPTYNILSRSPITTLADFQGKRIRTAGPVFTRTVEALGAEPVQMPSSQLFEALNSGVIDGTYSSAAELKLARLYDVVTDVLDINHGVFNGAAVTNASRMLWDRMSIEERDALVRATQYAQGVDVLGWLEADREGRSKGAEQGIGFHAPDASITKALADFDAAHLASVAETLEKRGVTNAADKVARYLALVEKWHGLVGDDTTAEQLAKLRHDEIWSKVDLATYGQ
ncbi:MAG: C4-dicarboxylate TRAP transporter substrate-binding protein [Neomegalonema sp.]|nr:C4-dicarboxylate TRAP transporter substrate-binding protein [Neomegalonema sp.]